VPKVIRIKWGQQRTPRLADRNVACRGNATILLTKKPNPAVSSRGCGDDLYRIVGRPVVDDDDLEVAIGLRQSRVDRFAYECASIKGGNDDRYQFSRRHVVRQVPPITPLGQLLPSAERD
jgi:hypothetical protein